MHGKPFIKPSENVASKALFIVPPRVHLLDVSGPAHIFYEAADYGASIQSHFINLRGHVEEKSSAGMVFTELEGFEKFDLGANDWVFIPGLESRFLDDGVFTSDNQVFYRWLRQQHENGAKICSVCTGAFLLAQSGILDGRSCTTHWKYFDRFKTQFPKVQLEDNRLFVVEDNIYTSAGVASGIDLALYMLEERYGARFASQIAKEVVVYLRRGENDPQLSIFLQYRNHLNQRVHDVQDHIFQHIGDKLNIETLASKVNMSPRNLTRLFKKTTNITIGQFIDKLRVERAIQLLGEQHKVDYVAVSCGFNSSNQLRSLLKKYEGVLPGDIFQNRLS